MTHPPSYTFYHSSVSEPRIGFASENLRVWTLVVDNLWGSKLLLSWTGNSFGREISVSKQEGCCPLRPLCINSLGTRRAGEKHSRPLGLPREPLNVPQNTRLGKCQGPGPWGGEWGPECHQHGGQRPSRARGVGWAELRVVTEAGRPFWWESALSEGHGRLWNE